MAEIVDHLKAIIADLGIEALECVEVEIATPPAPSRVILTFLVHDESARSINDLLLASRKLTIRRAR